MIIAIDFDGTCVVKAWPAVGRDVPGAVDALYEIVGSGHQLVLWTARTGGPLKDATRWFRDHGLPLLGVNRNPVADVEWAGHEMGPKVYADLYLDDAAAGCPLMKMKGEAKPVVDWRKLMVIVRKRIAEGSVNGPVKP
jgi:hypothetical protein